KNYKSVRDSTAELKSLNIVIGPNGAGKSALVKAISLMARAALSPSRVVPIPPGLITHGENALEIEALMSDGSRITASAEMGEPTCLRVEGRPTPAAIKAMSRWKTYDLSSIGSDSQAHPRASAYLNANGSNLSAFLKYLAMTEPRIFEIVKMQFSFYSSDEGADRPGWTESMSAGSLKMLALLALLEKTSRQNAAGILAIEHPDALLSERFQHTLAAYLKSVSTENQVIVTTHSSYMVDQFEPADLLIVEKPKPHNPHQSRTTMYRRLTNKQISDLNIWLEDYSLGELWLKNEIGARS
ncbi:MAG: AAA family ATPase, partial [Dehalococcoidia bacterium]|nr:AAA family ATPase [Dehalococcoidia bacterium]